MKAGAVAVGLLITATLLSCRQTPVPTSPKASLSPPAKRAVAAAETFVRQNGFVDQPADPKAIQWDITEGATPSVTPEVILEHRRHTIVGEAYGLSRGRGTASSGWTVYFEYDPEFLNTLPRGVFEDLGEKGRAVEVSDDFRELRMPNLDIFLRTAEVVLRPPSRARVESKSR